MPNVFNKNFTQYDGEHCPSCGSASVHGYELEPSGAMSAYRNCRCGDCSAEWTETLQVIGYDNLTNGGKE